MALTPNFTAAQTWGEENIITLTDSSTGSDGAITQRRVYFRQSDGTFLVPEGTTTEYVAWALADTSEDFDILTEDVALQVTVQWLNVSNVVLYDKIYVFGFTLYNETFDYGLTQALAGNSLLFNDNSFWKNKSDLRTFIDSGDQAISLASDLYNAQLCYDQATALRVKSQYNFNENS